jgi:hypothetical protein
MKSQNINKKHIGKFGIFWIQVGHDNPIYTLGKLTSILEDGMPKNACGAVFQKFIPIEEEEIKERIRKFEENEKANI